MEGMQWIKGMEWIKGQGNELMDKGMIKGMEY